MQKSYLAIAVASLLSYTSFSYAQDVAEGDTIVVTANRFEQSLKETIGPIVVITKDQIAAIQAVSLDEILQRLSGVQVISNGYGKSPEVYVRGTSARHQLVLVDGVRIGSATLGSTDLSTIPVVSVERIEFIKGSRAALYGSDAIGGVINIITSAAQKEVSMEIALGVGTNGYRRGSMAVAGPMGDANWGKVTITTEANDGFSSLPSPYEQDADGFNSSDVALELGRAVTSKIDIRVLGYYKNGKSEYDSGGLQAPTYTVWGNNPGRYSESENFNVAGKVNYSSDNYASELVLAQNRDNSVNKDSSGYNSLFETDRTVANWLHHYKVDSELAVGGGIEWQKEKISTSGNAYNEDERSSKALYLNSTYAVTDWLVEASIRTDESDVYGRNNTWQFGVESEITNYIGSSLNVGTAFKAPTFNDLYYPLDSWGYQGNPDIRPEQSKYIEASINADVGLLDWQITAFRTEIDDLIDWVYDMSTFTGTPKNVNSATIKGVELQLGFFIGGIEHTLSYDYTDARDDETGKELQRRSMHSGKWNAKYTMIDWDFDLIARYKGSSFNDSNNTKTLRPHTVLDGAVTHYLTDEFTVRARVANLLDHEYTTKYDFNGYAYNTAGREFYLNMSYAF